MSFPRYPAYRDSGVEWLGEVPSNWRRARFKEVFREREERSIAGDETLLSVSAYTGVTPRSEILDDGDHLSRAESLEGYKVCYPNDLVMNIMLAWNRGLGMSPLHGICSPAYAVFQIVDGSSPQYLHYLLRSDEYIRYFKAFSAGVIESRLRLYPDAFGALSTYLPPYEEQEQIACFLDGETAKIDALVAEQERLIALLKEKRQAVISHAVTKGLDPSAPMKDSGVEWLGQVPAHWAVGKCGFYIRILSGFPFPSEGFSHTEANHKLLRGANVGVSRLKWDDIVFWERSEDDGLDEYEMAEGDLVIGMDRPLISEGVRVAKVTAEDLPSLLLQRVASLKVGPKLHVDYLHHLLSSEMFIAHFSPETTGVSVPHISPDQINNFVIPVPPMSEQRAIVERLSTLVTFYAGLMKEVLLSIELLRERRSALISAAVTGQIDVRGLVTQQAAA